MFFSFTLTGPSFSQSNSPKQRVNNFISLLSEADTHPMPIPKLICLSHGALKEVCFTNGSHSSSHLGSRPRS